MSASGVQFRHAAPWRVLAPISIIMLLLAAAAVALFGSPAMSAGADPAAAVCTQQLPGATDGHLTLDRTSIKPGESTLAVLSAFHQWPQRLIGGGSGETFLSCAAWLPLGKAEVMVHDSAGLFQITVPAGTKPGTYSVGVVFYQGSTKPSLTDGGRKVRLSVPLTVTNHPATSGNSPVCQLHHAAASAGRVQAPSSTHAESTLPVAVTGIAQSRIGALNEYHQIAYVACFAGRTAATSATSSFNVVIPPAMQPGSYDLQVTGVLDGSVVTWKRNVAVAGVSQPTPTPTRTPTPTPTPTRTSTPTASASTPSRSSTAAPTSTGATAATAATSSPPTSAQPSTSAAADVRHATSSSTWGWLIGAAVLALAATTAVFLRARTRGPRS